MLYCQILAFTIYEKLKKSYKNNKFGIPAPTWKDKYELYDGSYCDGVMFENYLDHKFQ